MEFLLGAGVVILGVIVGNAIALSNMKKVNDEDN